MDSYEISGHGCGMIELTDDERELLAWDETAASDDGMTYDEWEAMRAAKRDLVLRMLGR